MKRILFFAVVIVVGSAGWWTCVKLPPDPGSGNPPVGVPKLEAPDPGAEVDRRDAREFLFRWSSSDANIVKYQFQISISDKFTSLASDVITEQKSLTPPLTPHNTAAHFWRVRGIRAVGDSSAWSEVRAVSIIAPRIELDPDFNSEFDNVKIFDYGAYRFRGCTDKTIIVHNRGIGTLAITSIELTPPIIAFEIIFGKDLPVIAQNERGVIIVCFQPINPHDLVNTLQIRSNDKIDNGLLERGLEGTGIDEGAPGEIIEYRFGVVSVNTSKTRQFIINNDTNSELRNIQLEVTPNSPFQLIDTPGSFNLGTTENAEPSPWRKIKVSFSPGSSTGEKTGSLKIMYNNGTTTINFKGTGQLP